MLTLSRQLDFFRWRGVIIHSSPYAGGIRSHKPSKPSEPFEPFEPSKRYPLERGAFNPRVSVETRVLNFNGNLGEAGGIQFTSFFRKACALNFEA
jgi:hypothetical protein